MNLPEIKQTGVAIGACAASFLTFFAGYNLFHLFCHDWTMSSILAFICAIFVFQLVPVLYITSDASVFRPSARPYNLTPMYALTEVKDGISTQYFGERRWHLENVNPESMSLFYVSKFRQEQCAADAKESQDIVVTMRVQVLSVGELSVVQLDFDTISGGVSQAANDLFLQTTEFIESRLLALQGQLKGIN